MMEDDIEIHMYQDIDLKNALLIDGFPTVGLVSTIVSSYIVDALELKRVGAVISRSFPAAAVIHHGLPSPPLRIYAGPKLCGPNNECEQVVVLTSEIRVPDELQLPLSRKILEWADAKGVGLILSVEGTPLMEGVDMEKEKAVFGAGSTERAREVLGRYELEPMEMGIITGIAGQLLYLGDIMKRDVLCLLAPAHAAFPDARAAATLIEVIDRMLPLIEIDTAPLLEQAAEIEKQIQQSLDIMKRGLETSERQQGLQSSPMYR